MLTLDPGCDGCRKLCKWGSAVMSPQRAEDTVRAGLYGCNSARGERASLHVESAPLGEALALAILGRAVRRIAECVHVS